jgi:beta-aspartyl-dipeptidase (metallo-type)
MLTLIQGGYLYGPEDLGSKDLLIANGKIERIDTRISPPAGLFPGIEVINASGKLIFPGLIDQHVHIIGGGGVGGLLTRSKEIFFRDVVTSGVTTLVGTLGNDTISRSLSTLLIKAKALKLCGINAFIYTGSLAYPPLTITGSIEKDLGLITEVIGVKLGLGESVLPRLDLRELENLITETRRAGSLSGKPAMVHIHLAASAGKWFELAESILEQREIPYQQIVFTHVNKTPQLLDRAFDYAKKGGRIDLTTCLRPPERPNGVKPSSGLKRYLELGGPIEGITFSSDGNSSRVLGNGVVDYTRVAALLEEFRDSVTKEGISIPQALAVVTRNVADRLGIANERGSLREGFYADLALFSKDLELTDLMAGGQWVLRDGAVANLDPFG